MFGLWKSKGPRRPGARNAPRRSSGTMIETLEDRRLLSAVHLAHAAATHAKHSHHAKTAAAITAALKAAKSSSTTASSSTSSSTVTASATTTSTTYTSADGSTQDYEAQVLDTIQFSQAPAAVQAGLTSLATTDGLAAPTTTSTVYLGNRDGIETYSLVITSSGTTTRLTVDQTGTAVTDPTRSTTTWGTLSATGAGSNSAAAAEISAIVTALGLTAPTSTTTVDVLTAANGTATYSLRLARTSSSASSTSSSSATTDWQAYDQTTVTVDSDGNPVGDQTLPFSVLPSAIQNGINNNLPSGETALAATSTQDVKVLTANGQTFFTTDFTAAGTTTSVTVDLAGTLATLPSTTTVDFSTIPSAAQTAIQTLATDNGVSGTIDGSQSVTVYDEGNGTTIYSVTLTATDSTTSATFALTISVDQAGNPTVPPEQSGGCGGDGGGMDGPASDGAARDSFGGLTQRHHAYV